MVQIIIRKRRRQPAKDYLQKAIKAIKMNKWEKEKKKKTRKNEND